MEQKIKQSIYCYLRILICALHMPQFCSSIPCQHGWIRLLLQFHNSINAVIESGDFGHSSLEVQVAINQQVKTLLKPAPSLWLTCNFTTVDGSEILQCIKPVENNGRYTTLVWWFQSIWKICSSKWVHLPQYFRVKIFQKYLSCHHAAVPHIKWCLPDCWTIKWYVNLWVERPGRRHEGPLLQSPTDLTLTTEIVLLGIH